MTPTIYVTGQSDYWLASIPALVGCIASGKTRDAAVANARRAFNAYRELLDARGVSVDHWRALDTHERPPLDIRGNIGTAHTDIDRPL